MDRRDFLVLTGAAALGGCATMLPDDTWARQFATFVSEGLASTHTPGMSVAIVANDRVVFSAGYGRADVETGRPVTADTVFQIASVSKTVTAAAMMQLRDAGAFQLDDPIARHLDFEMAGAHASITFRHLFTHTSGISDEAYDDLTFAEGATPNLRDFLAGYLVPGGRWYVAEKCFTGAAPGAVWSYSNVAVALLGYLAGRVNTAPLDTLTQRNIFQPLHMRRTRWRYEGVADDQLALPYSFADGQFHRLPPAAYPDWPAGLLCSSANDFARFLTAYTAPQTNHVLRAETVAEMLSPARIVPNPARPEIQQGLIWQLFPRAGRTIALHNGGDPGAATVAAIDPVQKTAALVFANITQEQDFTQFQREALTRLLDRAATFAVN